MTYLIWRLHRTHLLVAVIALTALVALLVPTGVSLADSYHQAVANCSLHHIGCGDIAKTAFGGDDALTYFVQGLGMLAPLAFGLFWGAPIASADFEAGTQDFIFTQGITRRRWIVTNIGYAILVTAVWSGALSVLMTWWRAPLNAAEGSIGVGTFDVLDFVPIAYAVFAVVLGIALGAVFRRVLPAIAVTLAGFVALRLLEIFTVRTRLMALTKTFSVFAPAPTGALVVSSNFVSETGRVLPHQNPTVCLSASTSSNYAWASCLAKKGYHQVITYLPATRFWPMQWTESVVFLVLALGCAAVALWSITVREA